MTHTATVLRVGFVFAFVVMTADAQTTSASITRTVTDPDKAVVPAAVVEATHVQSNYRYTVSSNGAGVYTLGQLREGVYVLRVKAPGFKEFIVENLQLVALDVRRIDARLEIGAVDTKVAVTAGATLIETETINTLPKDICLFHKIICLAIL